MAAFAGARFEMTTPDNITDLKPNEVFVFGSNLGGFHDGGAARVAMKKFGAVYGLGEGLVCQSYAFPTLDTELQQYSTETLAKFAQTFIKTAEALPAVTFYLTKVGCGIAGYTEYYMKQFFVNTPPNVVKPRGW